MEEAKPETFVYVREGGLIFANNYFHNARRFSTKQKKIEIIARKVSSTIYIFVCNIQICFYHIDDRDHPNR